jgi:hypothetical protein
MNSGNPEAKPVNTQINIERVNSCFDQLGDDAVAVESVNGSVRSLMRRTEFTGACARSPNQSVYGRTEAAFPGAGRDPISSTVAHQEDLDPGLRRERKVGRLLSLDERRETLASPTATTPAFPANPATLLAHIRHVPLVGLALDSFCALWRRDL